LVSKGELKEENKEDKEDRFRAKEEREKVIS
jgi:hypothetical protein